ncbi:MAG TPA: hypothetical protein VNP53_03700, partial [Methylomirabilota bacterium]|nr:hypothetical protein [Methylomirabilota bacterium]
MYGGPTAPTARCARSLFKTAQSFHGFEIHLTEVHETFSPKKIEKCRREPIFALDFSDDEVGRVLMAGAEPARLRELKASERGRDSARDGGYGDSFTSGLEWTPMRYTASGLMALAVFLGIGLTWGADPPTLEELATAIEGVRTGPDGERIVVGHISRKLAVSVEALRAQRAQTRLGWGEL